MEEFESVFTPEVRQVVEAVQKYGFDVRVVGGAVRDFLLGKAPRDIDIVTDADPAELILIYDLEGIQYDAGGIVHGTVKAVFGEEKVDVTSLAYRIEVGDDQMRIRRGASWEADAENRDLTINSMSLDLGGNVHDYVGGLEDLQDGVIRMNPITIKRLSTNPDLIMRWFKALGTFENPSWPAEDFRAIRRNLFRLAKVKDDDKTKKTLGSIVANPNGPKILDLICASGADKFLDINCNP